MANYSLIINSRFRPFEYQELLAPVLMATQAHQALEDAYADLQTKASIWDRMTNEATDPRAHAMYQKYADDLEGYANALSRYGLNPTSRRDMLEMRSRYAKDITPIENAYKKREEQAKEQRVAMMNNPTLLLSRRASQTSLDDYIDNPNLDYDAYSGALITQQVATAAANIAKEARDSEEGRRRLRQIIPYQYELVQQKGFSREAVMDAIMNSPNADRVLLGLVEGAINTSGVKNWGDASTIERAYDYARQGLYSAIGDTSYQMVTDSAGLQRNQYDLADRNNARQHGRQVAENKRREAVAAREAAKQRAHEERMASLRAGAGTETGAGTGEYRVNPQALRVQSEIDAANKEIDRYKKYFYTDKNGQVKMNHAGWEEYRKISLEEIYNTNFGKPGAGRVIGYKKKHSDFYNFVNKNLTGGTVISGTWHSSDGKSGAQTTPGWGPNRVGNAWAKYVEKNKPNSYDVFRSQEYDIQLTSEQGNAWKRQAFKSAKGNTLTGVEIARDTNSGMKWKETEKYTPKDLEGYSVSNVLPSVYGTTLIWQDKDGNTVRTLAPEGMNVSANHNAMTAMKSAQLYSSITDNGYEPDYETNSSGRKVFKKDKYGNAILTGTPLTPELRAYFEGKKNEALSGINYHTMQTVVEEKTKPIEYTSGY